jgi:hypothetical protein
MVVRARRQKPACGIEIRQRCPGVESSWLKADRCALAKLGETDFAISARFQFMECKTTASHVSATFFAIA